MSHHDAGPTGRRWVSRWGVPTIAVAVVFAIIGLVGVAVWASRSPDSPQQATAHPGQPSAIPSVAPMTSLEPSTAPSPSATPQPSPPDAGQPAPQPESSTKPVITAFAATANGLTVTVSFTFKAQAGRGPFTCSIRRASVGTDEFPCGVGRVSRTYDYDFCCGSEIYVIATDRHGLRSEQWNGGVVFPRPDRPTYSSLEAWHNDGTVYVRFYVSSAPGDDPMCDVDISQFPAGAEYRTDDLPCEGTIVVSLNGPPDTYHVNISITSDSHRSPLPPDPPQPVTAE